MNKLTDLEICKRIAEIEEFNQVEVNGRVLVSLGFNCDRVYNPVTSDALIWQLSKKYRVSIMYWEQWQREQCEADCDVIAHIEMGDGIWCASSIYFREGDSSLNKAICLAIIEAHKDQS